MCINCHILVCLDQCPHISNQMLPQVTRMASAHIQWWAQGLAQGQEGRGAPCVFRERRIRCWGQWLFLPSSAAHQDRAGFLSPLLHITISQLSVYYSSSKCSPQPSLYSTPEWLPSFLSLYFFHLCHNSNFLSGIPASHLLYTCLLKGLDYLNASQSPLL